MKISGLLGNIVHHMGHRVAPELITGLTDPEVRQRANDADENTEIKVQLVIAALNGLSIDTRNGIYRSTNETHTTYCVHFHTVSNPFGGCFVLSNESPMLEKLENAIAANLASKMFKAAKVYRRLQPKIVAAEAKLTQKAMRAYDSCLRRTNDKDLANAEYDKVSRRRSDQLNHRIRMIAHTACPAIAGKGYSQWLAEILYQNLPMEVNHE